LLSAALLERWPCKQCSTPSRTPEAHRDVQRVKQLRDSNCFLTLWRPQPDAAPLPFPVPLPAIADGVAAAFPLDGPIGLCLHRAVTALIRDHHLVAVSSRTHPTNVSVRPSWPELHRSSPPPSAAAEARCLEGHVRATGHLLGLPGQPAVTIFCIEGLVCCTALASARPSRSSTLRHGAPLAEVISTR